MELIVYGILFLLFTLTMGLMIAWHHHRSLPSYRSLGRKWHTTGWLFRLVVHGGVLASLWDHGWLFNLVVQLLTLSITWTYFDMMLNVINGWDMLHLDDHPVNRTMKRLLGHNGMWIIRLALFALSIPSVILLLPGSGWYDALLGTLLSGAILAFLLTLLKKLT